MDVRAEKEEEHWVVEGEKSRRLSIRATAPTKKKRFICNIKLYCDNHTLNNGGFERWE